MNPPNRTYTRRSILAAAILSAAALIAVSTAEAAVIVASEASLSAPAVNANTIVHFDEVANGTAINGLTIKGFTFSENAPNAIASLGGPGATNHISPPEALSLGAFNPATYVLTIAMPGLASSFGFGYAILDGSALTIALFDGANNVGSLTYVGTPDPFFAGGFAGIASTVAFNSAQVTFGPGAQAFAIDNVAAVAATGSVPDSGTTLGMLGLAFGALVLVARRPTQAPAALSAK